MLERFFRLVYPPKCAICGKILEKQETDLCHKCRLELPEFIYAKKNISFVAGWTALWYYKGNIRKSLIRFKFHHASKQADAYARLLAMKLTMEGLTDFDALTWIPISSLRKWKRGYDQVELIAKALGKEIGIKPIKTLRKIRNNPPQSGIAGAAQRRANVLGVYRPVKPERYAGKRILLLDDIITTGATASECARVLLTAGAKEVFCAAVAASDHTK